MDTSSPTARSDRAAALLRNLGEHAREQVALLNRLDRAVARKDFENATEVAEELLPMHVSFAADYRALLAAWLKAPRDGEVHILAAERSSS